MPSPIIIDRRPDSAQSFSRIRAHPTYEEVASLFPIGIDQTHGWSAARPGEWYWRLAGFSLNEGPVIYRAEVRDAAGNPQGGIRVVRHYPGAPQLWGAPNLYASSGVTGFTESGGDKYGAVEFVYTGDSVVRDGVGPDSFWVISPTPDGNYYSDRAYGLGWWGEFNHFNPSPFYQLTRKAGELPPQPEPEPPPVPEPPIYEPLGKFTVWRYYKNAGWTPAWTGDDLAVAFTRYVDHTAEAGPAGHVYLMVAL